MRSGRPLLDATWPLYLGSAIVLVVQAVAGWAIWRVFGRQDAGTFGDMFGAVNATFSGLAFAALVYTLHLQRRELALQRQELADTRAELAKQARAQADQAEAAIAAARISALGSKFQAMATLVASSRPDYVVDIYSGYDISTASKDAVRKVRRELDEALLAVPNFKDPI